MKKLIVITVIFMTVFLFGAPKNYNFMSYDLKGSFFQLKQHGEKTKAKYFVVDFFNLHCEPCKKALADWEKEYKNLKKKGVEFVLVAAPSDKQSARDEKEKVIEYFEKTRVSFPVMYDLTFYVSGLYSVSKEEKETISLQVPQVFLLDSNFQIIKKSENHLEILKEIEKFK